LQGCGLFRSASAEQTYRMLRTRERANPVATAVSIITAVIVAILLLWILLVLLEANPNNDFVQTMGDWTDALAGWSKDLFTPDNPKTRVVVNVGLAALVYAFIGTMIAKLCSRF
jgi:uncharacterized membrane protein YeaQ/YmgE (transglycosylase-associated protein family)